MASLKQQIAESMDVTPDMLTDIPGKLHDNGRVAGFEALRDELLTNWRTLLDFIPLPALVKLVLETDRHALFSLVAEAKLSDRFDREKWDSFQEYLRGEVSEPPRVDTGALKALQTPEEATNG